MWFYIKQILILLRLSLFLNKYFNLFNFLFIIKPFDLNLFNALVEDDLTTKENYKWWLQKLIFVTIAVVGIYVLYKLASNGTDITDVGGIESEDLNSEDLNLNSSIKTDFELPPELAAGPIITKHW